MSSNTMSPASDPHQPQPRFYVVSINKFIALSLLTCNLYALYWTYRNWATYRKATGERVIPLLRCLVPVLFIYPLLSRIEQGFKASGRNYQWSPLALSLGMWLVFVVSMVSWWVSPAPSDQAPPEVSFWVWLLLETFVYIAVNLWLSCMIQRAINVHERDPQGEGNSRITGANWAWMAFGALMWVLFIASMALFIWFSLMWQLSEPVA